MTVEGLFFCIVLCVAMWIAFFVFSLKKARSFISNSNKKYPLWLSIIVEMLSSIACVISAMTVYDSITNQHQLNLLAVFLAVISLIILSSLVIYHTFKYRKRTEIMFLTYMIPVGIVYMFLLYPDFIPDEFCHFMRAFKTSMLDLSPSGTGAVYGEYVNRSIGNVHDLLKSFYFGADTTLNVKFDAACSYNFIIYIIPALGLFIGRILHFSIYISYYLGRIFNFSLFLFFGYEAIKITPKFKWLFFVFYFNPMMIQLGISYSCDIWVNSFCVLAVAYFFYLYEKDQIDVRDIYVVMGMIAAVLIAKYVYFTVFGIYIILIPKLLRMPHKNWLHFGIGAAGALCLFFFSMKYTSLGGQIPSIEDYVETMGVDAGKQISWLLENPFRIIHMYGSTLINMMPFYISSFISDLGWLELSINMFSFFGFYILLFTTMCFETEKMHRGQRVWVIIVGLLLCAFIVLGLFLNWTPVGTVVTLGVQGRYFIPAALLLLIGMSNQLLKKIPNQDLICIAAVIAIQLPVMIDLMNFANII